MIAPHGLLHPHINLRGATLVTFGPLWIVAHSQFEQIVRKRASAREGTILICSAQVGTSPKRAAIREHYFLSLIYT